MKKAFKLISILTLLVVLMSVTRPYKVVAATIGNTAKAIESEEELQKYAQNKNIPIIKSQMSNKKDVETHVVKEGKPKLTKVITNQVEIEKYCEEHNIPLTDEKGNKVNKVEILDSIAETEEILFSKNNPSQSKINTQHGKNTVNPQYIPIIDFVVKDAPINFTGSKYVAYAAGPYPGTVTLSETYTEQATLSVNVSISKSIVTAEVGFDVTKSYSINPSYQITPTQAQGGVKIYAYPRYSGYTFNVYRLGIQIGSGLAYRAIGSQYTVAYYN